MSFDSPDIDDCSDPAVVMFKFRPVQARAHTDRFSISFRIHLPSSRRVIDISFYLRTNIHLFFFSVNSHFLKKYGKTTAAALDPIWNSTEIRIIARVIDGRKSQRHRKSKDDLDRISMVKRK